MCITYLKDGMREELFCHFFFIYQVFIFKPVTLCDFKISITILKICQFILIFLASFYAKENTNTFELLRMFERKNKSFYPPKFFGWTYN